MEPSNRGALTTTRLLHNYEYLGAEIDAERMPKDSRGRYWAVVEPGHGGIGSERDADIDLRRPSTSSHIGGLPTIESRKTRRRTAVTLSRAMVYSLGFLAICFLITPASAVLVSNFQNCLSDGYIHNVPTRLQFTPMFVDAVFDTQNPTHNIKFTVWGNVSGSTTQAQLPPPNDPKWSNPVDLDGKIANTTQGSNITALYSKLEYLSYEPWAETQIFCGQLINATCPLAPNFLADSNIPQDFAAFSVNNDANAKYAFASLTATMLIINGDLARTDLGCISVTVTPDLGSGNTGLLTFLPLLVLVFVAIATAFAGIWSPWGTTDIFRWTSNYGRDADLLRLVTPGFGDCLQYLQFVALTGGLTLSYPGYYQPVTSKVAWSALMFNASFVSHGKGSQSLVDGIYVTDGMYGLDDLSQLVGMTSVDDIWAGMAIWLMAILGTVMVLIQIGFLLRWVRRRFSDTHEEDLRAKNMPFSVGNVIRIVFSYFLLPIVALSTFQFVVASQSPAYTVALAGFMLLIVFSFAGWLLYVIASTRPRAFLFDDLLTVLLYGPLYNTYTDDAATFALVPVLITFVRGIAIGAVQPSGIAQLILLAICEVIVVLTIHAFRPFHSPTSMNAYHTFFSVCRFVSVILMVAFVPTLGLTEGPKEWIGYAILMIHGVVLVFGFLLNAIQKFVEVAARLAGAGGDESGAARGGLVTAFGMRQLSRRLPRRDASSRQSQLSSSAMLRTPTNDDLQSPRMRSQSGSSGMLLNRARSVGLESVDHTGGAHTPTTPGDTSMFSFIPTNPNKKRADVLNTAPAEASDPWYRPPRLRRPTVDANPSPGARSRASWVSGDWGNASEGKNAAEATDPSGLPISGRGTPVTSGFASPPGEDPFVHENRRSQTDYTTREVDFYYGVRGPALNANVPGRKLRTGPVDPTNNIATIGGFFKNLIGGKTKEKGKGFEVVRSSRMPPGMKARNAPGHESPPEGIPVAAGVVRNGPIDSDDDEPVTRPLAATAAQDGTQDRDMSDQSLEGEEEEFEMTRISDVPPSLGDMDLGNGFDVPSRMGSRISTNQAHTHLFVTPSVPRKSSKRHSQNIVPGVTDSRELSDVPPSPVSPIDGPSEYFDPDHYRDSTDSARLPFDRSNSNKRQSTISTRSSIMPPRSADASDVATNMGHVHNHSVRTINPDHEFMGREAEIVNEREQVQNAQFSHAR